jgi:hypothetical protein
MNQADDELEQHGRRFEALEKKLAAHIQKCTVCQGDEPCEAGEAIAKDMDEASAKVIELYEKQEREAKKQQVKKK